MAGIGAVPDDGLAANRGLELKDLNEPVLGPRSGTTLYGNQSRRVLMSSERKMSSGMSIDFVLVHRINENADVQAALEEKARQEMVREQQVLDEIARDPDRKSRERKYRELKKRKIHQHSEDKESEDRIISRLMKRFAFEAAMRTYGLDLEQETGRDKTLVFTKIHIPFYRLLEEAEKMSMNMRLIDSEQEERRQEIVSARDRMKNAYSQFYRRFIHRFDVFDHGEDEPEDFFCAPFKNERMHLFANATDEALFFNNAQRALLSHHLLANIRYGPKPDQFGIRKLAHNGTYFGAYPLHDSDVPDLDKEKNRTADPYAGSPHGGKSESKKDTRSRLYRIWGRIGVFHKRQPLELIRTYFGERVGIYFAWLGFYTTWLFFPAFVGFIVFIYGLGSFADQQDAKELCDTNNRLLMCPACDSCQTWYLDTVCTAYRFSWTFDNAATIFFAIFMSIWASVFQDFWRRRNAKLAYEWDVRKLSLEEPDRPQFKADIDRSENKDKMRINPITHREEKHYPNVLRQAKYTVTFAVVTLTISIVIMVAISIIVYRLAVRIAIFRSSDEGVRGQAAVIAAITAALINLLAITILNMLYGRLAIKMTNWENHRKDSKYESHLAFKIFVFQFVNTYSSLFYVAYFKGQFNGYPGNYSSFFGLRPDECADYGCLLELTIQLSIIMVGKQIIGNITEFIIPRIQRYIKARHERSMTHDAALAPWEEEFRLEAWPERDMFYEYLEMIIQFGFITLFVASFPLSPLFALANNIFEIRVDADKMITGLRRPPAFPAANIGIWEGVLEFVSFLSVITNGLVIAVTSSYLTKLVYRYNYNSDLTGYVNKTHPYFPAVNCSYTTLRDGNGDKGLFFYQVWASRLAFLILFEHFVYMAKFFAQAVIPNLPRDVRLKIEREEFLAAQALEKQFDGPRVGAGAPGLPGQVSTNSLA